MYGSLVNFFVIVLGRFRDKLWYNYRSKWQIIISKKI